MKHMKVLALITLSMMAGPLYAGNKPSLLKKMARIAWYGAETGAGWYFLTSFHNRRPQSVWPWDVASKVWNDKRNAGSEAVASVVLLWHGLHGLDRELNISEQFKK